MPYSAYCMAPSFFSWLGRGTSRRGLPVMLSRGPLSCDWVWRAEAGLEVEEDMKAAGPAARKGMRDVEGLACSAVNMGWQRGRLLVKQCERQTYLAEPVKLSIGVERRTCLQWRIEDGGRKESEVA